MTFDFKKIVLRAYAERPVARKGFMQETLALVQLIGILFASFTVALAALLLVQWAPSWVGLTVIFATFAASVYVCARSWRRSTYVRRR